MSTRPCRPSLSQMKEASSRVFRRSKPGMLAGRMSWMNDRMCVIWLFAEAWKSSGSLQVQNSSADEAKKVLSDLT